MNRNISSRSLLLLGALVWGGFLWSGNVEYKLKQYEEFIEREEKDRFVNLKRASSAALGVLVLSLASKRLGGDFGKCLEIAILGAPLGWAAYEFKRWLSSGIDPQDAKDLMLRDLDRIESELNSNASSCTRLSDLRSCFNSNSRVVGELESVASIFQALRLLDQKKVGKGVSVPDTIPSRVFSALLLSVDNFWFSADKTLDALRRIYYDGYLDVWALKCFARNEVLLDVEDDLSNFSSVLESTLKNVTRAAGEVGAVRRFASGFREGYESKLNSARVSIDRVVQLISGIKIKMKLLPQYQQEVEVRRLERMRLMEEALRQQIQQRERAEHDRQKRENQKIQRAQAAELDRLKRKKEQEERDAQQAQRIALQQQAERERAERERQNQINNPPINPNYRPEEPSAPVENIRPPAMNPNYIPPAPPVVLVHTSSTPSSFGECGICMDDVTLVTINHVDSSRKKCGESHDICASCFDQLPKTAGSKTCPFCRGKLSGYSRR